MGKISISAFAITITLLLLQSYGLADDVEYDVCTCKQVQIGAQSSLRRGVCQRTEAGVCLMQWGATSRQKVPAGNGASQEEASIKAEDMIKRGADGDFKIVPLISTPGNFSSMQIAIANLSQVPPDAYGKLGMVESFLLAASTALARFDVPIDVLARNLLKERRLQLIAALQKEGILRIESFEIKGRSGCLQIDTGGDKIHVYIKTPFASSESC